MFQYFIKVVSTKFQFLNGTLVNTNQIAVTEHEKMTEIKNGIPTSGSLPGLFDF